jgi:putative transposase
MSSALRNITAPHPGSAERLLGSSKCPPGSCQRPLGSSPQPDTSPHRGWYSRGYLPHHDQPSLLQAITYRLADSLPAEVLSRFDAEVRRLPTARQEAERRRRIDAWLDSGHGCCALRRPEAALCVVENWRHFDGTRYDLIAWVVMPNHVHVLIRVYEGIALGAIVQSWKSYTGRRIRAMMAADAGGQVAHGVWMREYWDRFIRDEGHFHATVEYIHHNPVKAGLVSRAEAWPWSSAYEGGSEASGG